MEFSDKARTVLDISKEIAVRSGQRHVGTENLLLALTHVKDSVACNLLKGRNILPEKVAAVIREIYPLSGSRFDPAEVSMSPRLIKVVQASEREAARLNSAVIGTEHLLLALLLEGEGTATHILDVIGVIPQDLLSDLMDMMDTSDSNLYEEEDEELPFDFKEYNGLASFGRDMTEIAGAGLYDPFVGREGLLDRIVQILARRTKNSPVIIGDAGVGKTALVEGIAQLTASGRCPATLRGKRIFSLDVASLVAGAKYRGEFEDRLKKAIDEVIRNGDTVIFIDEIHNIVGAGNSEGSVDAASIIKPYLSRGEIQIIGATTTGEYRKHIEKDPALERRMQPVYISEPSFEETYAILKGIRRKYEEHHSVSLPDDALNEAIKLSVRYLSEKRLPDKAIDVIDEACAMKRMRGGKDDPGRELIESRLEELRKEKDEAVTSRNFGIIGNLKEEEAALRAKLADNGRAQAGKTGIMLTVTKADISDVISSWTGIPANRIDSEDTAKLVTLEDELARRIIGQEQAIKAVASAIKRNRTGLRDPGRPVGSFIFLGPTGVGKTEMSKALAGCLFDSDDEMIRLDMSEYMEKHSVSKLIGSPPGYVGYEEGGQLTEKVKRKPYSIVLFDEIEKAHPDIFNILLQILDEGVLTDSQGQRIDFKNSVIIMTSNVGAKKITNSKALGFTLTDDESQGYEDMKKEVLEELKNVFRPEFINRIDDVIVFRSLNTVDAEKIAGLLLKKIEGRLETNGMRIFFDESIRHSLAMKGYSAKYGARPLRRLITVMIENRLSDRLLLGEFSKDDTVYVTADSEGEPVFSLIRK